MLHTFQKLWNDDRGALIAVEWVFVATILVIGTVVGLSTLRNSVNSELSEVSGAVSAMNQSYQFSGQSNQCCGSSVAGSGARDGNSAAVKINNTHNVQKSNIDDNPCS